MASPRLQAFLICDDALRDQTSGKVRINGVFDHIAVRELPAVHRHATVYVRLLLPQQMPGVEMGLAIVSPSGQRATTETHSFNASPSGIVESTSDLDELHLPESGTYRVELVVNGETLAEYGLDVVRNAALAAAAPDGVTVH